MTETNYAEHYTDDDINRIGMITELTDGKIKHAQLARLSGMKQGTLSSVLNGNYISSPTKWLEKIEAGLNHFLDQAAIGDTPFIETSVSKLVNTVCSRTRKYRDFGVISGWVGTGKTQSLKQYTASNRHTVMIEADPAMTPKILMADILAALNQPLVKRFGGNGNQNDYFHSVVSAVRGTSTLIIVDEADKVLPSTLEYLRRIRDKADIGIVLAGTEELIALLKPAHGQFDQIRSRVSFWPDTVRGVTKDDMRALADSLLPDETLTDAIYQTLWDYTHGSARMLCQALIPALKDFGLKKHDLSPALIDTVADQALGLRKGAKHV